MKKKIIIIVAVIIALLGYGSYWAFYDTVIINGIELDVPDEKGLIIGENNHEMSILRKRNELCRKRVIMASKFFYKNL